MPKTYLSRYGYDWPVEIDPIYLDLMIAKKHRELAEKKGIVISDPWDKLLSAARALISADLFKVSPWTEQHAHDFTMYNSVVTWGSASSSKSNDYGLFALLDWITDPYTTLWLIGSSTMKDLKRRTWESVSRYYSALLLNKQGFSIPGRLSEERLFILNVADPNVPGSGASKAGIMGVALDEGRLQGSHLPYVRVLVDELATISDHESLKTDLTNLNFGTDDFRFYGLANPKEWTDESCQYCMPANGQVVDVDTGSWMSTRGVFVRHHDGLKSPCMLDPSLASVFPFLMQQKHYDAALQMSDGNKDAPRMWQQVRGFPSPAGVAFPSVLDPRIAANMRISSPPDSVQKWEGAVAGIDPAWSEGGDAAIYARADIVWSNGVPVLDFTGHVHRLHISATSTDPVTKQLRDAVLMHMRAPGAPSMRNTAVDSSGNQGLADDLDLYVGGGCMHVNNAEAASGNPLRATGSSEVAKDVIADRGTESWVVLADFCKAGQVKGLPEPALRALTSRRFAGKGRKLRLEAKEDFCNRFGGSPNECDACALAALAAKERFGLVPFGNGILPAPAASAVLSGLPPEDEVLVPVLDVGGYEPEFGACYEPG